MRNIVGSPVRNGEIEFLADIAAHDDSAGIGGRIGLAAYQIGDSRQRSISHSQVEIHIAGQPLDRKSVIHRSPYVPIAVQVDRAGILSSLIEHDHRLARIVLHLITGTVGPLDRVGDVVRPGIPPKHGHESPSLSHVRIRITQVQHMIVDRTKRRIALRYEQRIRHIEHILQLTDRRIARIASQHRPQRIGP